MEIVANYYQRNRRNCNWKNVGSEVVGISDDVIELFRPTNIRVLFSKDKKISNVCIENDPDRMLGVRLITDDNQDERISHTGDPILLLPGQTLQLTKGMWSVDLIAQEPILSNNELANSEN